MEYGQEQNQLSEPPLTLREIEGDSKKVRMFILDCLELLPDSEDKHYEEMETFINMDGWTLNETPEDIVKSFISSQQWKNGPPKGVTP